VVGGWLARRALLLLTLVMLFGPWAHAQEAGLVQAIQIHGNRRIPIETIKARLTIHDGDVYDPAAVEQSVNSLWNTGYFDDIRVEREESAKGWILHFYVKEKPTIRTIEYKGLNSVSQSDVLDRFKQAKVGLSVESQYDPTKVKKAEVNVKELLAEHGRQFATIRTEVRPIPPSAVGITFVVREGPKVKVGKIRFTGNKNVKERDLRAAMKNLKPIGIPHSIILENLFSRTFDSSKLEEDTERVRQEYQHRGYFKAVAEEPITKMRDTKGGMLPFKRGPGKAVDITIPIEEGDRYRLGSITFTGNKAITNTKALRAQFPIQDGDIFNTELIHKGLDNLHNAYGALGYINFTPVPDTKIDDDKKLISLVVDIDEGKQFFVRRIEFQGNVTTRDKVIRRELPIEEGQAYNSKAWEFGILRLNQLGYFENIKNEQDTEIKKNEKDGTVDLTLKLKEKGKNSIGLTGGVSGLAGGFIGINYETNNLFGLGETLSIAANVGNRERNIQFGFTEPYLLDRPLQFGFTVYSQRYQFDQAKQTQILTGTQLNLPSTVLNTLQNFTQSSTGFSTSLSYQLRRSLKRVGISYSLDRSSITTFSDASKLYFDTLAFRSISGPDALKGVLTSKIVPTFTVSTINNFMRPTGGHSIFAGLEVSGLGGNVRAIRPIVEFKQFRQVSKRGNVLGYRVQGSFITGYSGLVAPPLERFYLGGDQDIRGFDVRAISPVVFLTTLASIPLQNPDGSLVPLDPANPRAGNVNVTVPVRLPTFPGGDTSLVTNLEYRVPIVGPVAVAAFMDTGFDFIARQSQLRISTDALNNLNNTHFGCAIFDINGCNGQLLPPFSSDLKPVSGTNFTPRMSTGLELQVLMPIINQPFRIYYAFNPLLLDTIVTTPNLIKRSMFPPGGAGDFTYLNAISGNSSLGQAPAYLLRDPRKTFRFTVSTTF
jgi:outer membrane protein insertion porin family